MSGRRKTVRISEAEWRIMNVLWAHAEAGNTLGLTLGEIVRQIAEETEWTNTAIRTLLIRLSEKGVVSIDKTTGVYKYMPSVPKDDCVREEVKSFVARVFDNSPYKLMASLVKSGEFSEQERREIIDILNKNQ